MQERTPPHRPPLVLIANDQEWSTRSLESILWPNGYAVLRAYTGKKALERSRSAQPDLIIIDTSLPDMDSLALCAALRSEDHVHDSTPIIMTAPVRPSRQQRLAALRAGAWEFLNYPLDAEERGLADGETVRVFNDRGEVLVPCRVTPRIMPGVVNLPQGAWWSPDESGTCTRGSINVLTSEQWTPFTFG